MFLVCSNSSEGRESIANKPVTNPSKAPTKNPPIAIKLVMEATSRTAPHVADLLGDLYIMIELIRIMTPDIMPTSAMPKYAPMDAK